MAADQNVIAQAKNEYNDAKARGDTAGMAAAHAKAEAERAKDGYSGGADGSQRIVTDNIRYGVYDQRNPDLSLNAVPGYTNAELRDRYGDIISGTQGGLEHNSATGYYSQTPVAGAEYVPGYGYLVQGEKRQTAAGTSGADETFLSDGQYAVIKQLQQAYSEAQARGDTAAMAAAHNEAERIRASAGYSGGADGSQYIAMSSSGGSTGSKVRAPAAGGYSASPSYTAPAYSPGYSAQGSGQAPSIEPTGKYNADTAGLKSLLEQWQSAANAQQSAAIDYNVRQAVAALERALEDAQPQFVEQQESIARDERQAMDNSALYAELRGDKGGIGQAQYNEVQAQAARNRQTVREAQTKLATDTARQIEDLRAQGEFQKADAMLQISQQYLSKLMDLEQWAQQYNLSAAQFEASLQEWQYQYQMAMDQFNAEMGYKYNALAQDQAQFDSSLGYNYAQLAQNQSQFDATMQYNTSLNSGKQLASLGQSMLSMGIMPTAEQLTAMNMTQAQASQYLAALQLQQAAKSSGKSGSSSSASGSSSGSTDYIQALYGAGKTTKEAARNYLMSTYGLGYNTANSIAAEYMQDREKKEKAETRNAALEIAKQVDTMQLPKILQDKLGATQNSGTTDGMSAQNFAAVKQTVGRVVETPESVNNMLDGVWKKMSKRQQEEIQALLAQRGFWYEG